MSITNKLAVGAVWNFIAQIGTQGFNFIVTVILASVLSPSDFGLLGMVMIFTSFFGYFTEFGLVSSLIQKKDVDKLDEYTAFWTTLALAISVYLIVYFLAPFISGFYDKPELTEITRVLFVTFLIVPLYLVPETMLKKNLDYKVLANIELVSDVISGTIAIACALWGLGVWSLVIQVMMKAVSKCISYWFIVKWVPKLMFSIERLRYLLSFGVYYTVKSLLEFVTQNLDYLIVGKLLGEHALGVYTLAFRLAKYPFDKLWKVFGQMLFPAFSSFKDSIVRVKNNYYKVSVFGAFVLPPLIICIYFGVDPFVALVWGDKWEDIIPIVQVFCLYLVISSFCMSDEPILSSIGKVRNIVYLKAFYTFSLAVSGYFLCIEFGLLGMAWAFTMTSMLNLVLTKLVLHYYINESTPKYAYKHMRVVLINFLALFLIVIFTGSVELSGYIYLFLLGFIVFSIAAAFLFVFKVVDINRKAINIQNLYTGLRD